MKGELGEGVAAMGGQIMAGPFSMPDSGPLDDAARRARLRLDAVGLAISLHRETLNHANADEGRRIALETAGKIVALVEGDE